MSSSSLDLLLNEYAQSHQNLVNQKIHKICVPLIEWSLLGVLYALPRLDMMGALAGHPVTWAHLFALLGLAYYLQFRNWRLMLGVLLLMAPFWIYVAFDPPHLLETSIVVFILAWIGQFIGHHLEGKKPSFFRDVFFLLIGPLWVLKALSPKFVSAPTPSNRDAA